MNPFIIVGIVWLVIVLLILIKIKDVLMWLGVFVLGILVLSMLSLIIYTEFIKPTFYSKDCLKNYAVEYCESQNLTYRYMERPYIFTCQEQGRTRGFKYLYFTEEEQKTCRETRK